MLRVFSKEHLAVYRFSHSIGILGTSHSNWLVLYSGMPSIIYPTLYLGRPKEYRKKSCFTTKLETSIDRSWQTLLHLIISSLPIWTPKLGLYWTANPSFLTISSTTKLCVKPLSTNINTLRPQTMPWSFKVEWDSLPKIACKEFSP